jgi:hypothetical protein
LPLATPVVVDSEQDDDASSSSSARGRAQQAVPIALPNATGVATIVPYRGVQHELQVRDH